MNLHAPSGNDDGCGAQRRTVLDDVVRDHIRETLEDDDLLWMAMMNNPSLCAVVRDILKASDRDDLRDQLAQYAIREIHRLEIM